MREGEVIMEIVKLKGKVSERYYQQTTVIVRRAQAVGVHRPIARKRSALQAWSRRSKPWAMGSEEM
jgi:hypothetical protein